MCVFFKKVFMYSYINKHLHLSNFHSCTFHSDVIQSFISPTNAQLICVKTLKFTLKYITIAPNVSV
jgi:hypothetical protein